MMVRGFFLVLLISVFAGTILADQAEEEEKARIFLEGYDRNASFYLNQMTLASWNYETNITEENAQASMEAGLEYSNFRDEQFKILETIDQTLIKNATILRQLKFVGVKPLSEEEEGELGEIISKMGEIYGSTKICPPGQPEGGECLNLEPGITEVMATSTDFAERTYYWEQWRTKVGRQLKPKYERYVELKNKRAIGNNYKDYGEEWRARYEMDNFEDTVLNLYQQMEPLYKELHAYVRNKLNKIYGDDVIDLKGKLPASVLSDMWGRFWNNLYQHLVPYPDKPSLDPTEAMKKQNYTVEKMFRTGDDFYIAMGLKPVPDTFWNLSMLVKPSDGREVICHATAWDFYDKEDYRIRMCTRESNFEDLNTIHHELGHIQYDQHYKDQPIVFRDGANDGFHEAIGEMMAMSGATPKHLYHLGLIEQPTDDEEQDINFLMSQALITISTLPFHLVNDLWRWRAFRGEYQQDQWNNEFWKLKEKYLGVKSPVERTSEDLDPPTIFHICQDYDMIRYFTRTILQFQFAERLCELANQTGPLHRCDFSGSKEAGKELGKMLELGSSQPWQDAMFKLTGTREMSVTPILKFFQPLHDWLKKTNAANGDTPGWEFGSTDHANIASTSISLLIASLILIKSLI